MNKILKTNGDDRHAALYTLEKWWQVDRKEPKGIHNAQQHRHTWNVTHIPKKKIDPYIYTAYTDRKDSSLETASR